LDKKIEEVTKALPSLSAFQLDSIHRIILQLKADYTGRWDKNSDIVTKEIAQDFGDALRIHHVFSAEALSKDRFEFALERVMKLRQVEADRAPRGNPGHDITIKGQRYSLKTQADKNIKADTIHISKFMELGKGEWTDKPEQLQGLLDRFLEHMGRYERILTLRRLKDPGHEFYELVEIPKDLLLLAATGTLSMDTASKQMPKPGHCVVEGKFELYFDGGTERKLQVRKLKKSLCTVHAIWRFPRRDADAVPVTSEEASEI
jgi:hypothetical protein